MVAKQKDVAYFSSFISFNLIAYFNASQTRKFFWEDSK